MDVYDIYFVLVWWMMILVCWHVAWCVGMLLAVLACCLLCWHVAWCVGMLLPVLACCLVCWHVAWCVGMLLGCLNGVLCILLVL